jgi:hypothetical protein
MVEGGILRNILQFDTLIPMIKPTIINPREKAPIGQSSSALLLATEELLYIPLKKIRLAESHKQILYYTDYNDYNYNDGDNNWILLTPNDISLNYSAWLERKLLLLSYDIFLSYRRGGKDAELVSSLFEMFKKFPIGLRGRAIRVFLDDKRLQLGQDFQVSFGKSLINSSIMTPIISEEALGRMISVDCNPMNDPEDNVLVEWIIGLNCSVSNGLHIFPIVTFDIWASKMKIIESIPNEIHQSSLRRASQLLSENHMDIHPIIASFTMRDIVVNILKFLGCKLTDSSYKQHAEKKVCEEIISILNNIIITRDEDEEQVR